MVKIVGEGDETYLLDPSTFVKELRAPGIRFLGESSGPPEDQFNDKLLDIYSEILQQYQEIKRAFLVRATYEDDDEIMALCLESSGKDNMELVETLALIFTARHRDDILDIMYLRGPNNLQRVKSMCKPFYEIDE